MLLQAYESSRVFYGQMADLELLSVLFDREIRGVHCDIEGHTLVYQTIDQVRGFMHPILLAKWGPNFRSWGITHRQDQAVPAILVCGLTPQDLFVYRDWEGIDIDNPAEGWFVEKIIGIQMRDSIWATTETFQPEHEWHEPEAAHFDEHGMSRFWLPRDEVLDHARKIGAEKRLEFLQSYS